MKIKAKLLDGFDKSKGLLGKKVPESVYFTTRWGVHTFFMKFPIDVVIIDDLNAVVKIKKSLKPFRIFLWNPKYKTVLELPEGSVKKKSISLGSIITIS